MNGLKLIDAGLDGSVVWELHIAPSFSNLNSQPLTLQHHFRPLTASPDVMHGGAAGVIFDMATTSALCPVARPGFWEFMGGVTRTLNISYLKAVPVGTTVRLNSKVESVGRQMAMIRGVMTSLDGKTTYCTAEHHKVNTKVQPEHVKVRVPWDDEFEREWGSKSKL
jgi:acyl-coenzyme A thioesterase PaaI-like protein